MNAHAQIGSLEAIGLQQGALVTAGTMIGLIGKSGSATGPHIHFWSNQGVSGNFQFSLSVATSAELLNPSFENGIDPSPWARIGPCNYLVYNDSTSAQQGSRYLAANRNNDPTCSSIYQDVTYMPTLGENYRLAIWVRSATGATRDGMLALWAFGGQNQNTSTPFSVSGSQWQCVETSLSIQRTDVTVLRAQIYLDSLDA